MCEASRSGRQVFAEPGEPAVESVALIRRDADAVELPGIYDEFGWNAESAQGLVHLFAAGGGHIEIFFSAHK